MPEAMILTLIGRKRLASIIAGTTAFDMAYVAVGTGGSVALDENQTALRHEVCRETILEYSHSGNQLVITAVLMPCYTVAQVNEIGVFAADGTLLIVGLLPATMTSASIEQGAKTRLRFRISITVGNDGTTTILMDNNTALAFIDMSNVVASDIVARGVVPGTANQVPSSVKRTLDAAQNYASLYIPFKRMMPGAPTSITLYNPSTGAVGSITAGAASVTANVSAAGVHGVNVNVNNISIGAAVGIAAHVLASREI